MTTWPLDQTFTWLDPPKASALPSFASTGVVEMQIEVFNFSRDHVAKRSHDLVSWILQPFDTLPNVEALGIVEEQL